MQKQPFTVGGGGVKSLRTGGLKNFRTGGVTDLWRLLLLGGSVPHYVHNAMILVIFSVFFLF